MSAQAGLPAELTIYTVTEQHAQYLAWLNAVADATAADSAHDEAFELDGANVDEVDAAGVQLLLAFSNALIQTQRSLRLRDPSLALAQACDALGASALLVRAEPAIEPAVLSTGASA
jgi:anti-anti-sigma regulatory factor